MQKNIFFKRFSCGQMVADDCEMKSKLTGHRVTPERQFTIFEKIHQSFNACGTRSEPWPNQDEHTIFCEISEPLMLNAQCSELCTIIGF